jgi:hypothetical protein
MRGIVGVPDRDVLKLLAFIAEAQEHDWSHRLYVNEATDEDDEFTPEEGADVARTYGDTAIGQILLYWKGDRTRKDQPLTLQQAHYFLLEADKIERIFTRPPLLVSYWDCAQVLGCIIEDHNNSGGPDADS